MLEQLAPERRYGPGGRPKLGRQGSVTGRQGRGIHMAAEKIRHSSNPMRMIWSMLKTSSVPCQFGHNASLVVTTIELVKRFEYCPGLLPLHTVINCLTSTVPLDQPGFFQLF